MPVPVEYHLPEAVSNPELTLDFLGRKLSTGQDLTLTERGMAMGAASQVTRSNYGPGISDMQPVKQELPESVKGILANYTS